MNQIQIKWWFAGKCGRLSCFVHQNTFTFFCLGFWWRREGGWAKFKQINEKFASRVSIPPRVWTEGSESLPNMLACTLMCASSSMKQISPLHRDHTSALWFAQKNNLECDVVLSGQVSHLDSSKKRRVKHTSSTFLM